MSARASRRILTGARVVVSASDRSVKGHRSILHFESRKWVHKSAISARPDHLISGIPKSNVAAVLYLECNFR
jgi:hypothetical protein